jgi:acrylyl-CoA reductase (NADPH)
VNYKDGLCIGPVADLVRNYPHVPGIDLADTVESSNDPRYKASDKVVFTGWNDNTSSNGRWNGRPDVNAVGHGT